jgi:protein-disulfide isomerase
MKRFLPFIIIAVVGVATVGGGTYFFRQQQARLAASTGAAPFVPEEGTKPGANPPHIRGDKTAPVTIEEFADFQCPPCGMLAATLHELEKEYQGKFRVVFRHFPLDGHANARPAALAAEAAAQQGKFWEMHDRIYQQQKVWSTVPDARPLFAQYAGELGLNVEQFNADVQKPETAQRVDADRERGLSLKVSATPSVFLNRQSVPFAQFTPAGLKDRIDAALKESQKKP